MSKQGPEKSFSSSFGEVIRHPYLKIGVGAFALMYAAAYAQEVRDEVKMNTAISEVREGAAPNACAKIKEDFGKKLDENTGLLNAAIDLLAKKNKDTFDLAQGSCTRGTANYLFDQAILSGNKSLQQEYAGRINVMAYDTLRDCRLALALVDTVKFGSDARKNEELKSENRDQIGTCISKLEK